MAFWDGTRWVEESAPRGAPRRGRRSPFALGGRAVLLAGLVLAVTAGSVFARGGKSGSSIELVIVGSSVTAAALSGPTHGDTVTFAVSTTVDRPYVVLNCYAGGAWVYAASAPYWDGAVGGQEFVLDGASWPSGAASCSAQLGNLNADGTRFREVASTTFDVAG